jgi:hypothetical protein
VPRPRRTVQVGGTGAPSVSVPPARDTGSSRDGGDRSAITGRTIAAAGALAVAVVIVLLVSGVIGGSGSSSPSKAPQGNTVAPTSTTTSGGGSSTTAATIPPPSQTRVSVLNGTTFTGLAATAADRLQQAGYPSVGHTDASDQAQQTSQVAYISGYKGAARKIAVLLGISARQVGPIDPSTQAVADADGTKHQVVVTLGLDHAH